MKLTGNQGAALTEQRIYNSRLQPTGITLGTSPGSGSVRGLTLDYGSVGNNGNLSSQIISGAGLNANAVQSYHYDRLNRIQSADEAGGSAWSRGFDCDRYGNCWTSGVNLSSFTPQVKRILRWSQSPEYHGGGLRRGGEPEACGILRVCV